jgi:hypothetical protein
MAIVAVIPPHARYAGNGLFEGRVHPGASGADHPHAANVHWMDYCIAFREEAARVGLEVATADVVAPDNADVLLLMGVPPSPPEMRRLRTRLQNRPIILVTLETALGHGFMYNESNTAAFDAIITYNIRQVDHRRYHPLRPIIGKGFDRVGLFESGVSAASWQRISGCDRNLASA